MLSRRSVRIKVMQLLFALGRDEKLSLDAVSKRYNELIDHSFEMTLFNLYILIKVAEKSEDDQVKRNSKHLPSEYDKQFSAILYHNEITTNLAENENLEKFFKTHEFEEKIDEDIISKIYKEFSNTDIYKDYIALKDKDAAAHTALLLELSKSIRKNEHFTEMVEDYYTNWFDDSSLVIGSLKKIIKALPLQGKFYRQYYPDDETVAFGKELLHRTVLEDSDFHDLIEPALKNWDSERLAIIDMILLKMALCEFTGFPTVPTKVSLNEYVEVAKMYSTPKSKDFINGILDRLMKQLEADGKIKKEGRGLIS